MSCNSLKVGHVSQRSVHCYKGKVIDWHEESGSQRVELLCKASWMCASTTLWCPFEPNCPQWTPPSFKDWRCPSYKGILSFKWTAWFIGERSTKEKWWMESKSWRRLSVHVVSVFRSGRTENRLESPSLVATISLLCQKSSSSRWWGSFQPSLTPFCRMA